MKPPMNSHGTSHPLTLPRSLYSQTEPRYTRYAPMANSHRHKAEPFKSGDDDRRRSRCCNKHPKHRQSPGVCSLCLTERLSLLSSATSSRKTSASLSSSSLSSYYSSASSCSSCSSPVRRDLFSYGAERKAAPIISSSLFKKSRSLAFVRRSRRGRDHGGDNGTKNLGFWSKLLGRPRRKAMELGEVLTHSRTVVVRDVHG